MTGDAASERDTDAPLPPEIGRPAAEPGIEPAGATEPSPPFYAGGSPATGSGTGAAVEDEPILVLDDVIEEGDAIVTDPVAPAAPDAAAPAQQAEGGDSSSTDISDIADTLEALASRLRTDGAVALDAGLAHGNRLDALLSGLLRGYLAGGDR